MQLFQLRVLNVTNHKFIVMDSTPLRLKVFYCVYLNISDLKSHIGMLSILIHLMLILTIAILMYFFPIFHFPVIINNELLIWSFLGKPDLLGNTKLSHFLVFHSFGTTGDLYKEKVNVVCVGHF